MLIKPPDYCTGVLKADHHERLLWNVQFYLENKKQNCEAWNMIRATNMNFKTWRMRLLVRKPVSICCDYHLPHAVWNITGCWWNERVFYPNILKVGWIWGFCSPLQNSALSSVLKFTDLNFLHWWIIHLSVCLSVQAQSQRSAGSATLRPTVCQVLAVSVKLVFRGTAPSAVQSHVSVLQLRTIYQPEHFCPHDDSDFNNTYKTTRAW